MSTTREAAERVAAFEARLRLKQKWLEATFVQPLVTRLMLEVFLAPATAGLVGYDPQRLLPAPTHAPMTGNSRA